VDFKQQKQIVALPLHAGTPVAIIALRNKNEERWAILRFIMFKFPCY